MIHQQWGELATLSKDPPMTIRNSVFSPVSSFVWFIYQIASFVRWVLTLVSLKTSKDHTLDENKMVCANSLELIQLYPWSMTFSHLIEWRKDMKTKMQKDTDQKESLILCCQGDVAMFHKDTFSRPMAKKLRNLYRVKTMDFVPCMVKICCVNLRNLYIHSRNVFMWVSLSGMFDESINSWSYSSTQSPILDLTEILLKLGLNFHIWHTFRALPELIRRECHNL